MTRSEQHALEIVANLKSHPIANWQSQFTTWIVGRSMTSAVNRHLRAWGVLVPTPTGNYEVNYDAPVFANPEESAIWVN